MGVSFVNLFRWQLRFDISCNISNSIGKFDFEIAVNHLKYQILLAAQKCHKCSYIDSCFNKNTTAVT